MIHKRPYIDDPQVVASKHPRKWEDSSHFASIINGVLPNNAFQNHQISSTTIQCKWEDIYAKHQDEGRFTEDECNNCDTNKEYESSASGCVPHFWWVDSNGVDADIESEVAIHLPLFPEYFTSCHQNPAFVHPNEVYSSLLSPRELVFVGPEYQADIPEWIQQDMKCSLDCLDASDPQVALKSSCAGLMADNDYGKKMMEAREKLRENLGSEIFRELGFCDMGEEVAKRWTEDEELAFDNVFLSNPFSLENVLSRTELTLYMLTVMMMSGRHLSVQFQQGMMTLSWNLQSVMKLLDIMKTTMKNIEDDDNNEDGVDSSKNFDDIHRAVTDENEGVIDEMSGPHVESSIHNYFCNDLQLREQVDYHGLPKSVMDANSPVADKFKSPLRS
ncbi:hypothetical protein V6N13_111045 [Hibiscus sabdariffa]